MSNSGLRISSAQGIIPKCAQTVKKAHYVDQYHTLAREQKSYAILKRTKKKEESQERKKKEPQRVWSPGGGHASPLFTN